MTRTATRPRVHWRRNLRHYLPAVLSAIPVVIIPALEWIPGIPQSWRPWVIIGSLGLAAIGILWSSLRGRKLEDVILENDELRAKILKSEPEFFLQQVATTLFKNGAWRLSVLEKTYDSGTQHERLERLASASSDLNHTALGPSNIPIEAGTQFAHIFTSNLADPRFRRAEESGSFPSDGDPLSAEWTSWRDGIFGDAAGNGDASSLRARKFAWFAAQDPKTSKVFVVLAESAADQGIAFDLLNHPLTPSWVFFVAHLAELRRSLPGTDAQADATEALIGRRSEVGLAR